MTQPNPQTTRALVWFSCGAASAVAAKLAVEKYGDDCEVLYCDTFAYEHPDNPRFLADVERWIDKPIKILKSPDYTDIYDVFRRTGWLIGPKGARCTTELKINVRKAYQRVGDIHILGFTADEADRITDFMHNFPDLIVDSILLDAGIMKKDCYDRLRFANIGLPLMYELGYGHNNCIGCVKGSMGYWNKIRKDFPEIFDKMAKMEREIGHSICKKEKGKRKTPSHQQIPVYLDELNPKAGNFKKEPDISCGVLCQRATE